jgi:hypothetical protein
MESPKVKSKGPADVQDILIKHGVSALVRTVLAIERLWAIDPKTPADKTGLVIEGDPAQIITDLCNSFASASTILFDDGPQRSSENRKLYELRKARAAMVAARCPGLDLSILAEKVVRNRIVHLDEHLAKIFLRYPEDTWIIDVAISSRKRLIESPSSKWRFSRVYVFDERKIFHLDAELDVAALHEVAIKVLERLVVGDWRKSSSESSDDEH